MSRARTLLSAVVPSLVAGGLLFGSAFSAADPHPRPRPAPSPAPAPAPPEAPAPPDGVWTAPPAAPAPPAPHRSGVSVNIHDGKVEVSGIEELVEDQLAAVHDILDDNPDIPRDVRAKLKTRMSRLRGILKSRLGSLKTGDVNQIQSQMQAMSQEINDAMQGLEGDLAGMNDKLGAQIQKQLEQQFSKGWGGFGPGNMNVHFGGNPGAAHGSHGSHSASSDDDNDNDSDDSDADVPDVAVDSSADIDDAMPSLRGMTLRPDQRATLAKLRMDSEQMVAAQKHELDEKSRRLESAIQDATTPDAELERQIEDVSRIEAKIRTARIIAWHKARKMLDDGQRARVEAAVKHRGH